ncbi:MAG TPA: GatB/YqeY domain-containing protein [Chloroflexota bacterium]|nr:GatB/YqeY domain-containing protein [Chloroflexota bacterium]
MGLRERLEADQRDAMRSGHTLRLNTIRMLRNAVKNAEIARRVPTLDENGQVVEGSAVDPGPLTDEEIEDVLAQQIKQRRDSIAIYKKAGRQDLYEKEEAELEVLLAYQPQRFSAVEVEALVRNAIAEVGATSPRETGKVMGRLAPQLRDKKMDLGAVREVVERVLAESAGAP